MCALRAVQKDLVEIFDDLHALDVDLPLAVISKIDAVFSLIEQGINAETKPPGVMQSTTSSVLSKETVHEDQMCVELAIKPYCNAEADTPSGSANVTQDIDSADVTQQAVSSDLDPDGQLFAEILDFKSTYEVETTTSQIAPTRTVTRTDRNAFDYLASLSPISVVTEDHRSILHNILTCNSPEPISPDYDFTSPVAWLETIVISSPEQTQ